MDSQQVEILGRSLLKAELIRAGLEVSTPERDNGIDLLIYRWKLPSEFIAVPLQMKASSEFSFSIERKYERIPRLVLAYVVGIESPAPRIIALTYQEAFAVADALKWTDTRSWREGGKYTSQHESSELARRLEAFTAPRWERFFDGRETR